MPAQEATSTSPASKKTSNVFLHIVAVFLFDVLFIYFFEPQQPAYCILLAALLWRITWDDYKSTTIDIRYVAFFFLLGLFIRNHDIVFSFYAGLLGFLVLHAVHEAFAIKVPAKPGTTGDFHYQSSIPGCTEENAPPYLPCFTGALFFVLAYYLLALPLPESAFAILYAPMPYTNLPLVLWALPACFLLIAYYFYRRNKNAIQGGYNIVYRGFGDGDIYFLGASIGVFGFFLTLLTVTISLILTWFQIRLRVKDQPTEKSGGIEIEH